MCFFYMHCGSILMLSRVHQMRELSFAGHLIVVGQNPIISLIILHNYCHIQDCQVLHGRFCSVFFHSNKTKDATNQIGTWLGLYSDRRQISAIIGSTNPYIPQQSGHIRDRNS